MHFLMPDMVVSVNIVFTFYLQPAPHCVLLNASAHSFNYMHQRSKDVEVKVDVLIRFSTCGSKIEKF